MTSFAPLLILEKVFFQVRKDLELGMGEYFAALEALEAGWGKDNPQDFKNLLQLLWCHSPQEQEHLSGILENILTSSAKEASNSVTTPSPTPEQPNPKPITDEKSTLLANNPQISTIGLPEQLEIDVAPIRAPFNPIQTPYNFDLQTDFPLTMRSLIYHWRYLRRPVADGIPDLLNVEKTVKQTANQGFFLAPVCDRRETNHAHLILMIDCRGSMTPFHRITRELVETAETILPQVETYYFYNIPGETLGRDPHLTQPILLKEILATCDGDSSLLIVSDGGAARGYRKLERIDATTQILVKLKQKTNQIAWLNPMPQERWPSTSAQIIAYLVSMYPMDNEGMSNAIDRLRGVENKANL